MKSVGLLSSNLPRVIDRSHLSPSREVIQYYLFICLYAQRVVFRLYRFLFPEPEQVILIRSTPDLLTFYHWPFRSDLRCTADHHAVPPFNQRPVEGGIMPDHFSTGWKNYTAHHDLSERAWPIPAVFQTNIRSPWSRSSQCRSVHFSKAGDSGGWSALWSEGGLKITNIWMLKIYFDSVILQ